MVLPPPVSGIIEAVIPACFSSNMITKGLQHSNGLIRGKTAEFLCVCLEKLDQVVKLLLKNYSLMSDNQSEWNICAELLVLQVQKRIPEWQTILSFHHFCNSEDSEDFMVFKRYGYKLIFLYQKFYQESISLSKFNHGKILSKNMSSLPLDIQYMILEILENAGDFKFWISDDSNETYLQKLLQYFVSCKNLEISNATLKSLVSCLSKCSLFRHNSEYLFILFSVLRISSKHEQGQIIYFLDKCICEAEKNHSRFSAMQKDFWNFIGDNPGISESDTRYFFLYWCSKLCKQIKFDLRCMVRFLTRLLFEHLHSLEDTGDNLFYVASDLLKNLESIDNPDLQDLCKPLQNAIKIIQTYCKSPSKSVMASDSLKRQKNTLEVSSTVTEDEISILLNQHPATDVIQAIINGSVNLSSGSIHEIVSFICLNYPVNKEVVYPKIPSIMIHFVPSSFLFEYDLQRSNANEFLLRIKDMVDCNSLKFSLMNSILHVRKALAVGDSCENIDMYVSVIFSIFERSITLNISDYLFGCSAWNDILNLVFNESIYSRLLLKDAITIAILRTISKILSTGKNNFGISLDRIVDSIKLALMANFGPSFPTIADQEIFQFFKFVPRIDIYFDLLNLTDLNKDVKRFCWILEKLVDQSSSNVIPGLYLTSLIEVYVSSPSEEAMQLLIKIFSSLLKSQTNDFSNNFSVESDCANAYGTNIMIIDCELIHNFVSVIATRLEIKWKPALSYLIQIYPESIQYIIKKVDVESQERDVVIMLLECILQRYYVYENSFIRRKVMDSDVNSFLKTAWDSTKSHIIPQAIRIIHGHEMNDESSFLIFCSCSTLFEISEDIITAISGGISKMSCGITTISNLIRCIPVFKIFATDTNRLCMILNIYMRLLRGFLIFMQKEKLSIDFKAVAEEISEISNRLKPLLHSISKNISLELITYSRNLAVTALKSQFNSPIIISCVRSLWDLTNFFEGEKLLEMILTHSMFEDIMKTEKDQDHIQFEIISFIRKIMESDPMNCCQVKHLEKLIPLYGGLFKASDRILLFIFGLYEVNLGISALEWIRRNWIDRGNGDILLGFDSSRMIQSVMDYPSNYNIEDVLVESFAPNFVKKDYYLYDISFLVPFAASLVFDLITPVDLYLFFKSNLFSIIVMGLSNTCEKTRMASSSCMNSIYTILTSSSLKEKQFLMILMDSLRNAIISDGKNVPRIPRIVTYFVSQASVILLNAESVMYPLVNRFLLQRPILDFKVLGLNSN